MLAIDLVRFCGEMLKRLSDCDILLDDEDGYDGIAFNRFLADCARKGVVIPWEDVV